MTKPKNITTLTPAQAVRESGLSKAWIYRCLANGELKSQHHIVWRQTYEIDQRDFDAFLAARAAGSKQG